MDNLCINGLDYLTLVESGANSLALDLDRINALNVFPVPDGDTGTNMNMTIQGGVKGGKELNETNIGVMSKSMARSMVLSARGNSGVILSQFFKGISNGLKDKESVNVKEFALALIEGTKKAYNVVSNPTEGTILTVIKDAGQKALSLYEEGMSLTQYLQNYVDETKESLKRTPDLLPVLKKAGVVDSGGAGLVLIAEGMLKASKGEAVSSQGNQTSEKSETKVLFNADSELTFGYCTEFILQLQNSKVDTKKFDLEKINTFLYGVGNSIVSFKDEDIVKVHVHTFDPGKVLTEMKKYGEFISVKIENMNLQNEENSEFYKDKEIDALSAPSLQVEHKEYALVAVASGRGIIKAFKDMGVDEVVSGGQTMNTSTQDFIDAFNKLNADYIFVYPNNRNIKMAAEQAAKTYKKAKVIVIPTKTIAQGYSAISMINFDSSNIDRFIEEQDSIIDNLSTLELTYAIRDTEINDIKVSKDDFIALYQGNLIASNKNKIEALKDAISRIEDFEDKAVMTIFIGKDGSEEEINEVIEYAQSINSFIEVYPIEGQQEVYSYIIGIE